MNFLQKIWKEKKKLIPESRNHVFTDIDKNKWFAVDPQKMHTSRVMMAWIFSRDSQYSLSREKLKTAIDKIKEALNKKDIVEASQILGVIDAATELYCEESILLNLACCYSQLEGEPEEYKDQWQQQKREIWSKDIFCKSFFLQYAVKFTARSGELQGLSVLNYLEQAKPTIDLINYHLSTVKSTASA